jgi:hypothetical protein
MEEAKGESSSSLLRIDRARHARERPNQPSTAANDRLQRAGEGYDPRRASAVHEFLSKQQTSRRSQEAELRQRQAVRQQLHRKG